MRANATRPARKVVIRSTHRVVGYHFSRKNAELVAWESRNEQAFLEWLEVDAEIVSFVTQPRTFKWSDFRYTPDVLVRTRSGSYFVEVKPDAFLNKPVALERHKIIASRMVDEGYDFRLVLSGQIFNEPLRTNVRNLSRGLRRSLPQLALNDLLNLLKMRPHTIQEVEQQGDYMRELIMPSIAQCYIAADLTQELRSTTILRIPS